MDLQAWRRREVLVGLAGALAPIPLVMPRRSWACQPLTAGAADSQSFKILANDTVVLRLNFISGSLVNFG